MPQEVKIISFPKCGRTWFTLIIGRILQRTYNFPEKWVVSTEKLTKRIKKLPNIEIVHEGNPHLKEPVMIKKDLEKVKAKYKNIKAILLVRDLRDVMVSYFFHMKKRKKGNEKYLGNISQFIRRERGGADSFITYYQFWEKNKSCFKDFLIVTYEDILKDTFKEIKKTIQFLDLMNISDEVINEAIKYCSFNNMKKMESQDRFKVKRLRPGNKKDPESYKVRKGESKGYVNYLEKQDILYLDEKMKKMPFLKLGK